MMGFKLNVALALVSLTAAAVAAFFSWKSVEQEKLAKLTSQVDTMKAT